MFHLTGIFSINGIRFKNCKAVFCFCVKITISVTVILVHVYLTILALQNHKLYGNPVANTAANIIKLIYRCFIHLKWKRLVKICSLMSSFRIKEDRKYRIWICIYVIINIAMGVPLAYLDVKILSATGIPYRHYGISRENNTLYVMAAVLHSTFFYFFSWIMMIAFDLFYLIVCDHMKRMIKNFSAGLGLKNRDYNTLLHSYAEIKSTIVYIDSELSLFMFLKTILTSVMMYYTVSALVHADLVKNPMHTVQKQVLFVYSLASFVVVVTAASAVSEASLEVRQLTQAQKLDKPNVFEQQKFQACAESEICLTVWKIVPLSRSFALGTISAIFTYAILVDSLIKK
ncbi:hypothetical protein JTE90_008546 [Oedothorax gibbosus]|uniref:Gustatory receptor n=1 Tax=Oedothorax gibbosus TaxID=931172 RepID=A0AAV6VGQ6_9ARAC|nr:hypothetical protein JTE90_008546 [Oedothorax gibbosus]